MRKVSFPFGGVAELKDYTGPRTAKGLTDFAKDNMENRVTRLTDDNLSSFFADKVFHLIAQS
jgi:hypothetical protein